MQKGTLAALFAPFFIALSIIITKAAGQSAEPLVIAGLGSLVAVPFLLLMQAFSKSPLELRNLVTAHRGPFLKVLFSRAILGQILIVTGFTLTTAVKAVLLLRLEPIFVFGWSVFWHTETPHKEKILLLLVLLFGSALVVFPQDAIGGPNLGDALVVASLFFLSYSYMPTAEIVSKANPAGLNLLTNIIGGGTITLLAGIISPHAFQLSQQAWSLILGYSITFFVIGATLYFYAFKTIKPWVISSFLSLEVVFGLALASLLLKESIAPVQYLGAAIVLAATLAIGRLAPRTQE